MTDMPAPPRDLLRAWFDSKLQCRWATCLTPRVVKPRHPHHDHPSLWWCRRGTVLMGGVAGDIALQTGMALLLPALRTRREQTWAPSADWELVGAGFTIIPTSEHRNPLDWLPLPVAFHPSHPLWSELFTHLLDLRRTLPDLASRCAGRGILEVLVWSAIVDLVDQGHLVQRRAPLWLTAVRDELTAHRGSELTVADLADLAGVTPRHLARTFKDTFGCTPMVFRRRAQLEQAARLLSDQTDEDMREIARRCGYRNLQAFSTAFRKQHGVPPRAWRAGRRRGSDHTDT